MFRNNELAQKPLILILVGLLIGCSITLLIGCGAEDESPEPVEVETQPEQPAEQEVETQPEQPPQPAEQGVCQVGDILQPGDSCTYPGTNNELTILDDGSAQFLFFTAGQGLNIKDSNINGKRYTLVANKRDDGSWEIEEIGD